MTRGKRKKLRRQLITGEISLREHDRRVNGIRWMSWTNWRRGVVVNSRAKGVKGELEWARLCREHGYTEARRGQQHSGIEGEDVVGLPGMHQEVKRRQALNLDDAMQQATRDAKEGRIPMVAHRRNNERWKVTMWADDWFELYREWEAGRAVEGVS